MKSDVVILLLLFISRTSSFDISSEHIGATKNSSSAIRRKSPPRMTFGPNRLSLMNSRYNRRPRKKNLDPEHLMDILGDFYDPNWMSIEEPESLSRKDKGVTYMVRQDAWPYQELTRALRILNLTTDLEGENDVVSTEGLVSIMENWLLKKASCPVKYGWEDVGSMFWPRWIKRGECATVPGTCSWPPGMHCVETGRSNLHVLRWQCRTPKGRGRRRQFKPSLKKEWGKRVDNHHEEPILLKCQWVRVPYPITSACHCTC